MGAPCCSSASFAADALALVRDEVYHLARPFPPELREAVSDVARVLGLPDDWLNPGPTDQLTFGLPPGFPERTTTEVFASLTVRLAGRFDLICFKLFAATDQGPTSKHVADLLDLNPSAEELREAAGWVKTQDASPEFKGFFDQVIAHVEARLAPR